jgi:cyclopropane-fatty-acyl-phospholipid synthase
MFEHMANWPRLLERIRPWITPYGRLFVHVFSHRHAPYRFDAASGNDWIGQHFFSGGIMPSHDLMAACASGFRLEETWRWNGQHYARTARHWIENFTTHAVAIDAILRDVYGGHAREWRQRWRLFFLATEGLFAHNEGNDWGVSHYRLMPAPAAD